MDIRKVLPRLGSLSPESFPNTPFCVAVVWRAILRREAGCGVYEVWIEDDPLVATSSYGRKLIARSAGEQWKNEQLTRFLQGGAVEVDIASSDFPLQMSAGGALPILRLRNGQEFFILLQRDIAPYGWNTASGLSSNMQEICNPFSVVFRELFEELLICVDRQAISWHTPQFDSMRLTQQNLAMWGLDLRVKPLPFSIRENAVKHRLVVHYKDSSTVLEENVIVVVSILGIDALVIPIFEVSADDISQLQIYGCEEHPSKTETPLNPKVGLLAPEEARKIVNNQTDGVLTFAAIFKNGENQGPLQIDLRHAFEKENEGRKSGLSLDEFFETLDNERKEFFLASRYCPTVYQALQVFFAETNNLEGFMK